MTKTEIMRIINLMQFGIAAETKDFAGAMDFIQQSNAEIRGTQ